MVLKMRSMTTPNISRNYPLGGERIGPLWIGMWSAMVVGRWCKVGEFAAEHAERHGLHVNTAANLLRAAARAGLLEWEHRDRERSDASPKRTEVWFKRSR